MLAVIWCNIEHFIKVCTSYACLKWWDISDSKRGLVEKCRYFHWFSELEIKKKSHFPFAYIAVYAKIFLKFIQKKF